MNTIKNISKVACAAVAGAAIMSAGMAGAASLNPGPGIYTFTGTNVQLTQQTFLGPITITCALSLTGQVNTVPGGVTIEVLSGSVTGGGLCSSVSLSGWPWYATQQGVATPAPGLVPDAILPATFADPTGVPGTFRSVGVSTSYGSCNGSTVDVVFSNGSPLGAASTFSFSSASIGSNCRVTGVLTATSDIDVQQ